MQCNCIFNETTKTIQVSADTKCEWSCFVELGNITLNQYYGELSANGETELTIFTYNTYDIYGRVVFTFKNQTCTIKKICSFSSNAVQVLYANTYSVNLFGNGTKNYIYIYYRFIDNDEKSTLSPLQFTINGVSFGYSGETVYQTIQDGDVNLYNIILGKYNENNGYFEIGIYSLNNYQFKDIINISDGLTKIQIILEQYEVVNRPTLLKISPTRVFLSSTNPKQKINVSSIYMGQNVEYQLLTKAEFNGKQQQSVTKNAVEEYINNRSNASITLYEPTWRPSIEKNASHFVLNAEGAEGEFDNVDGNNKIAYQLYVVNSKDASKFQKLEFFYDHIIDPNNFIEIESVQNAYKYINNEGTTIEPNDEGLITFENGKTNVTLYFIKDQSTTNHSINNCIYVQYNEQNPNVIFTIKSNPNWWRILEQSDYVKEVKQGNKLTLSLEKEIPTTENNYVKLQGELGASCLIYVKNEEDIINKNKYYFGFKQDGEIFRNLNVDFSAKTITLESYSNTENLYYKNVKYSLSHNTSSLEIPTLYYTITSGTNEVILSISGDNYTVYYDQTIDKKYIIYGSKTYVASKDKYEIKDTNIYYFESNEITLPIPVLTPYAPWTIINNGNGVKFDTYIWEEKWVNITNNIPTYFPQSSGTTLYINTICPNSGATNTVYLITKNNIDYATISTIIFQQSNSLNDANLYINFQTQEQSSSTLCVHKYGLLPNIEKMKDISFDSLDNSISANSEHSGVVTTTLYKNEWTNLYYASYVKSNNNTFNIEDKDVEVYVPHEVETSIIDIDFNNNVITSNNNETYKLYYWQGQKPLQSKDQFWELSDIKPIRLWTISGGTINYTLNGTNYQIFPQINISKTTKGYVFERNQRLTNGNYVYFGLEIPRQISEYGDLIDDSGTKVTINVPCSVVPKSVLWQNQRYVIEDDIFYNPIDKKEYKCYYGDDGKCYINIPSYTVTSNSITSFTIQNDTLTMDDDGGVSYNGKNYYVDIKIIIPKNTCLQLIKNVEGYNNNSIDAFLILNKNKISCEEDKQLYINNQPIFSADDDYNYAIALKDCEFNLIQESAYEYITIKNEEYKLVNNELLYDGIIYQKQYIIDQNKNTIEVIVISNKGYQIKKHDAKYYFNINNKKYFINPKNDTYVNGEKYDVQTGYNDKLYYVQELINETINVQIDVNQNLYNSPLISGYLVVENNGTYYEHAITNGCINIGNNYYPILKEQYIEENVYPYNILSVEYISLQLGTDLPNINSESLALSSVSLRFLDETEIINVNGNTSSIVSANSEYNIDMQNGNIITINDYSVIQFNNNVLIKFNNDCIIIYEGQNYSFKKNEYLHILSGAIVTFTDITTIMFVNSSIIKLYAFTNVAVEEETKNNKIINKIYYTTIINGQEAIIDNNNNIVYVYDNKAYIQDKQITVYDRYVFVKQLNNSGITIPFGKEVTNVQEEGNELKYYWCNNESGITPIPLNSITNINWEITLPYYDHINKKIALSGYALTNIIKIQEGDINYNQITISNYSPTSYNDVSDFIIENGDIVLKIDLYKITPKNVNEQDYYTNSLLDYIITLPSLILQNWEVENHNLKISGDDVLYDDETHSLKLPLALDTEICIWDSHSNTWWKEIVIKNSEHDRWMLKKQITIDNITLNVDENNYMQIDKNTFCEIYGIKYEYVDYNAKKITVPIIESRIISSTIEDENGQAHTVSKTYYYISYETKYISKVLILDKDDVWDTTAPNNGKSKWIYYIDKYKVHPQIYLPTSQYAYLSMMFSGNSITRSYYYVRFNGKDIKTSPNYTTNDLYEAVQEMVALLMQRYYKIYHFYNNYEGNQGTQSQIKYKEVNCYYLDEEPIPMAIVDVNYGNNLQNGEYFIRYENDGSGLKTYEIKNGTVTVPRTFDYKEVNGKHYILFDIYAKLFTKFNVKLLNGSIKGIKTIQVKNDSATLINRQLVLKTQDLYGKYLLSSSFKWDEDSDFSGFDPYNGWEYADLGLPSGLKWAKYNVGSKSENDVGWFFAWADPQGYTKSGYIPANAYTKKNFDDENVNFQEAKNPDESPHKFVWSDYKWCAGSFSTLTKYVSIKSYSSNNKADYKTIVELQDDGCSQNMGGFWRMPTKDEIIELIQNTTQKWIDSGGTYCMVFTSLKDLDEYILFPIGWRCNNLTFNLPDIAYWSSSLRTDTSNDDAWLLFNASIHLTQTIEHGRNCGYPLRGVIK